MQFGFGQINNFKEISEDILEIFSDLELNKSVDFRVGGEWVIYYQSGWVDYIKSPDEINGKILKFVPSPWSWESKKVMKIEKGFKIVYKIELRTNDRSGVPVHYASHFTIPLILRSQNAHDIKCTEILTFQMNSSEEEYTLKDWGDKYKLSQHPAGGYRNISGANFYFEIYQDRVIDPNWAKEEIWDILSNLELEYKNIDLFSWKVVGDTIVYKFEFTETPLPDDLYKIFKSLDLLIGRSENMVGVKFKRIELSRNLESRNIGLWVSDSRSFNGKIGIKQFTIVFDL